MIELHEIMHYRNAYRPSLNITDARGIRKAWEAQVLSTTRHAVKGDPISINPASVAAVKVHRYHALNNQIVAQTGGVKLEASVQGDDLEGASIIFNSRGRAIPVNVWETREEVLALIEAAT